MTRLALAGKLGKPGSPPVAVAQASFSRRLASAATPMPVAEREKKWRRVRSGSIVLFLGNRLVEVQDQARRRSVRREFSCIQRFVARRIAILEEFFRGLSVGF